MVNGCHVCLRKPQLARSLQDLKSSSGLARATCGSLRVAGPWRALAALETNLVCLNEKFPLEEALRHSEFL